VHFGLGADKHAETVEIVWPSAAVQILQNVQGDQVVKVKEPAQQTAGNLSPAARVK
jgi:hypothetical protein